MKSETLPDNVKLISSVKDGERKAFDILFKNYSQRIYRFAFSYLKSKEDAEEIVQEVFIKLWDRRESLRIDLQISSFLFTIAYNSILNQIRKTKNGIKAIAAKKSEQPIHHLHVEEELVFAEYQHHAQVAISSLPPQRKKIFMLSREQHLSYSEIARELKISPRTVEVHISQALKDIKKHLIRVGISLSILLPAVLF